MSQQQTQQLIQSDTLSLCRLEMVEGIEVISRYQLFAKIISDELGPEEASILAEPFKNIEQDRISWYSGLDGEAVHFQDLSEEEQKNLRGKVDGRAGQFAEMAARLKTSKASNRVMAGELLERIFSRPDILNLYLVGGRPVVVGWGLSFGPKRLEGAPKDPQRPLAAPVAPLPVAPPAPASGRGGLNLKGCLGSGCLRLLLGLLLALLAGALLAWLLSRFLWPGMLSNLFNKPAFDLPSFGLPSLDFPNFDLPSFDSNAQREAQLREELGQLMKQYDDRRATCQPAPEPAPASAPEPEPAPPPEPPDNKDLNIPEEATENNDFSFLEGCWNSVSDLVNAKTNKPLIYIYCFDKNGQASVRIDEKDAQGRPIDTCRTTATAEFNEKQLVIRQMSGARCNKEGAYAPVTVHCAPGPEGAAECQFRDIGKEEARARSNFRRIEE
jgi:hypothetical protein